ncbi:MAG: phosphoribosylamine--glycine ligase [Lentisphaeria bacterium]|nr:phosphoribosylamine--glycine ligase [Lentisphaeria bacterium]
MNILVVGSGGREHALCWKIRESKLVDKLFCAPGNAGISQVAECVALGVDKLEELADFAVANNIELTVIGPEAPLCDGIVDVFAARGLKVFGPDKYAAQLEGSKDFAKKFMLKYNIPTAKAATFTDFESAKKYIESEYANGETSIVIKADGLAAGKGVLVAESMLDAIEFTKGCFDGAFGKSGAKVLIEECLIGEEASILALCDGKNIVSLASSQDHKRIFDDDKGPNTGGMGAYSPAPVVSDEVMAQIQTEILDNFLRGVQEDKLNFRGLIFVGVMVTAKGPKVLEFNVRFGDPEVQAVMRRLDSDIVDMLLKVIDGKLADCDIKWKKEHAVSVVMAAGGYPESYRKGDVITGLDAAAETGAVVFHAGTAFKDGEIVTAGGRVLGVSALGATIEEAIANSYKAVSKITWNDVFYRKDIAQKAIRRKNNGK